MDIQTALKLHIINGGGAWDLKLSLNDRRMDRSTKHPTAPHYPNST